MPRSVPPRRERCSICGEDTHDTAHHPQPAGPERQPGRDACARCGSTAHSTAEHRDE